MMGDLLSMPKDVPVVVTLRDGLDFEVGEPVAAGDLRDEPEADRRLIGTALERNRGRYLKIKPEVTP